MTGQVRNHRYSVKRIPDRGIEEEEVDEDNVGEEVKTSVLHRRYERFRPRKHERTCGYDVALQRLFLALILFFFFRASFSPFGVSIISQGVLIVSSFGAGDGKICCFHTHTCLFP